MKIDYQTSRKVVVVALLLYVVISIFLFIEHDDYKAYITFWVSYLHGSLNPTYPPTFSILFAPLYALWYKLPKLVFVLAFVVTMLQMHEHLFKHPDFSHMPDREKYMFIMLFFIVSPNCWWHVWTGLFDSLVGLFFFNMYLVLKKKDMNRWLKDIVVLGLILAITMIKFTGIFLIVPFLFLNTIEARDGESAASFENRRRKGELHRVLLYVCTGAIVLAAAFLFLNASTFVTSFLAQAGRGYETIYEFGGLSNSPFFLKLFVNLYSELGLYVFLVAISITYVYCYKARVSNEAWLLLPMLVFMTFFQVSHAQFILWIVQVMGLYYAKHDKYKDHTHLRRHMFWLQFIDGAVFCFLPFAQFMYLWAIFEIVLTERLDKERAMQMPRNLPILA